VLAHENMNAKSVININLMDVLIIFLMRISLQFGSLRIYFIFLILLSKTFKTIRKKRFRSSINCEGIPHIRKKFQRSFSIHHPLLERRSIVRSLNS
jgi:hypothetical protein